MSKFKVAGIATDQKGNTKVRYANDLVSRTKVLQRNNFTNVQLVQLPHEMTKLESCDYLFELDQFSDYETLIEQERDKIHKSEQLLTIKLKKKEYKSVLTNTVQTDLELTK